jgi:hypothetical protein
MRHLIRGSALTLTVLVVLSGPATGADDFKPEEGYVSLFNGKDLSGWQYKGSKDSLEGKTETPDKRIEVVDGVIRVNEGKGIKDLYTLKEFNGPFHLKLQFKAAPRADSGVYIRGPQLQVRDYPTVGPYKSVKFNTDAWNDLDITVSGPVFRVNGKVITSKDNFEVTIKDGKASAKLNGETIDANHIQLQAGDAALCKCNGEVIEAAMTVPAKGGIGLQAEVGKFEFRHIRVKEMAAK